MYQSVQFACRLEIVTDRFLDDKTRPPGTLVQSCLPETGDGGREHRRWKRQVERSVPRKGAISFDRCNTIAQAFI